MDFAEATADSIRALQRALRTLAVWRNAMPCVRDGFQQTSPQRQRDIGKFLRIVERTEHNGSVFNHWRIRHAGCNNIGLPAPLCVGQAQKFLGMKSVVARRIGHRVGNPVIHRGKTGRAKVIEPRHLHRCRPPRKDTETIVAGVTGDIDEDVDRIGMNLRCDLRVIHVTHDSGGVCDAEQSQFLRLLWIVEVAEHFKLFAVV